ncbi:MAG: cytochrome C554 [Calditrichaeota bacterium]|nr:MAG: cytochrome C554 [Calditrichota bacterium]
MTKMNSFFSMVVLTLVFAVGTAQAQSKAAFKYGGVATCKACHLTKKSGAQYKVWKASPHAKAFATLKSEKALVIAKKRGIDDPSKSEKCVKCHVTAFGVDAKLKGPKLTEEEGVSCEACHGPGSAYRKRKVMKDIFAGKVQGEKYGLVIPDEKVCVKCHNEESPTFKTFNFKEMSAKIAHPVPKKTS